MFDFSWHNILHSNLVNFLILFVPITVFLAPKVKKAINETTKQKINSVNNAIEQKEIAIKNLEQAKAEYENTPQEREEIEKIAQNTINSLKQKANDDLEKTKILISKNADKSVKNEVSVIISQLTKDTAEQSVKNAENTIKQRLSENSELHDILIKRAIDELEKI